MKKTLILVVALMLTAAFLLVGCGPETSPTNGTSAPTATPAPSEEPSQEAEKNAIKAGDNYRYYLWSVTDGENPFSTSVNPERDRQRWTDYQEKYGITITYVQAQAGNNWQDLPLSSAAAGEPICDIFNVGGPYVVLQSVFYDGKIGSALDPVSNYDEYATFDDPNFFDQAAQKHCTFDGELYCIVPHTNGAGQTSMYTVTLFNAEMLANAGYTKDDLYKMSKDGEWTWEAFREAAIRCTNPDKGVYGTYIGDNNYMCSALIASNGGHYFVNDGTGDKFAGNSNEAVAAWDFIVELGQNGYMDYSHTGEANVFGMGKVAMMVTCIARVGVIYQYLKFEYGIINPPKGPAAKDYISENSWFTPVALMKGANNPQGCVRVMKEYFGPEYGIDTVEHQMMVEAEYGLYLTDQGSLDTALNIQKYGTIENYFLYQTVNDGEGTMLRYLYGTADDFINGEQSPKVFLDSVVDKVNHLIEISHAGSN